MHVVYVPFLTIGPAYAKLVTQKSKGLPRISISLDKLVGGAASEAMGNVSLELYRAFKTNHELLAKGCVSHLCLFLIFGQKNGYIRDFILHPIIK